MLDARARRLRVSWRERSLLDGSGHACAQLASTSSRCYQMPSRASATDFWQSRDEAVG